MLAFWDILGHFGAFWKKMGQFWRFGVLDNAPGVASLARAMRLSARLPTLQASGAGALPRAGRGGRAPARCARAARANLIHLVPKCAKVNLREEYSGGSTPGGALPEEHSRRSARRLVYRVGVAKMRRRGSLQESRWFGRHGISF